MSQQQSIKASLDQDKSKKSGNLAISDPPVAYAVKLQKPPMETEKPNPENPNSSTPREKKNSKPDQNALSDPLKKPASDPNSRKPGTQTQSVSASPPSQTKQSENVATRKEAPKKPSLSKTIKETVVDALKPTAILTPDKSPKDPPDFTATIKHPIPNSAQPIIIKPAASTSDTGDVSKAQGPTTTKPNTMLAESKKPVESSTRNPSAPAAGKTAAQPTSPINTARKPTLPSPSLVAAASSVTQPAAAATAKPIVPVTAAPLPGLATAKTVLQTPTSSSIPTSKKQAVPVVTSAAVNPSTSKPVAATAQPSTLASLQSIIPPPSQPAAPTTIIPKPPLVVSPQLGVGATSKQTINEAPATGLEKAKPEAAAALVTPSAVSLANPVILTAQASVAASPVAKPVTQAALVPSIPKVVQPVSPALSPSESSKSEADKKVTPLSLDAGQGSLSRTVAVITTSLMDDTAKPDESVKQASGFSSSKVELQQLAKAQSPTIISTLDSPKAEKAASLVSPKTKSVEKTPVELNPQAQSSSVIPTVSLPKLFQGPAQKPEKSQTKDGRKPSFLDSPPLALLEKLTIAQANLDHEERKASLQQAEPAFVHKIAKMTETERITELKKELAMDEHLMTVQELCQKLGTDPHLGLTDAVVTERLLKDGPNSLKISRKIPRALIWLSELTTGFSLALLLGGFLAIVAYIVQSSSDPDTTMENLYLGLFLIAVVLITASFSYALQWKHDSILYSFKKLQPRFVAVIRNGEKRPVVAADLVVGDIVELKPGDRIPADLRVIETRGLKVDNSSLTGESYPQHRTVESTNDNPFESKNIAFYSTYAVEGYGIGVVIKTGPRTKIGRIAQLSAFLEEDKTPLSVEIYHFVKFTNWFSLAMGLLVFFIAMACGRAFFESALLFVGILVANVPEGIIPATTVALALTAKRLAKQNCLVKHLSAVETLGTISVICSDKTGTLTQNRMTVSHLWFNQNRTKFDTSEEHNEKLDISNSTMASLLRCAALCNDAIFKSDQDAIGIMKRETEGDASETALLKFTETYLGNIMIFRLQNNKVAEIPFNHINKYQLSIHEVQEKLRTERTEAETKKPEFYYLLVLKGAPEKVIDFCSSMQIEGKDIPLTPELTQKYHDAYAEMGGQGERVLGFAELKLPVKTFPKGFKFSTEAINFPMKSLTFLGLISLVDPPRSAVPEAVRTCQEAGIRVIMITGDHPTTAKAIARAVGIIGRESETVEDIAKRLQCSVKDVDPANAKAAVITGSMLKDVSTSELMRLLSVHPEMVFARTSPQQKLTIVEALQQSGSVVAVTGDGVNDAPALKKANMGIAMGLKGSDVSRDAAEMILLDDNFASVVSGIQQGRLISDNLRKTITYMLTSNIPEIFPFIVTLLVNLPQALSVAIIIYIDLGTDIIPGIAIMYEPPETNIMKRSPRDPKIDRIFKWQMLELSYLQIGFVQTLAAFFMYFVVMAEYGFLAKDIPMALWSSPGTILTDSFGQEWTYYQRRELELTVQGAFFVTIVITQWINLICCRQRTMTIFSMGNWNCRIYFALLFETAVAWFILYTPYVNRAMQTRAPLPQWWSIGIVFSILIFVYDELRRWLIRKYPTGFFYRETYY